MIEKEKNISVDLEKKCLYIWGEYNSDFILSVKKVDGKWDSVKKKWVVKFSLLDLWDLERVFFRKYGEVFKFVRAEELKSVLSLLVKFRNKVFGINGEDFENFKLVFPEGKSLYRFQEEDIKRIFKLNGRVLLGLEMGLGKTVETIVFLNSAGEEVFPGLIVCPAIVKWQWRQELKNWLVEKKKVQVLQGIKDTVRKDVDVWVVNYDVLQYYVENFVNRGIRTVVLDECHYVKNRKAKRTQALLKIAKNRSIKNILALSGTPLLNRPDELWVVLHILKPEVFKSYWEFVGRYCQVADTKWGMQIKGGKNLKELSELLHSVVMIRREKKEVLSDLPDKIRTIVPIAEISDSLREMDEDIWKVVRELEDIEKEGKELFEKGGSKDVLKRLKRRMQEVWFEHIGEIERYRKMVAEEKFDKVCDFIDSLLEGGSKVVVFVYHRSIWERMMNRYGEDAVGILGNMKEGEKELMVKLFNEKENKRVFVGSIRAAGEGINLQVADKVVFLEYDWTPARLLQCEDRLHRIGQKGAVNSYWFVLENSVDEWILRKILQKMDMIEKIMGVEKGEEFFFLV